MCYVDDATYSVGHHDPAILSFKLTDQYKKIEEYMASNKLVINGDKTHLVVMGTKATAAKRDEVTLQAGQHTTLPSSSENQSLVRQITNRTNGLCMISKRATFATRLMVANGVVISKLC